MEKKIGKLKKNLKKKKKKEKVKKKKRKSLWITVVIHSGFGCRKSIIS
jgi:hypothetical protein